MVIGIRGESGAGKSLLASMLCYILNNLNAPNLFGYLQAQKEMEQGFFTGKWRIANFASTLKASCSTLYGIDHKLYEDGSFKDSSTGITVWTLNMELAANKGYAPLLVPVASRNSEDAINRLADQYFERYMDDVTWKITKKTLTWRDTLNDMSDGIHLTLGQDITLQAYQHRFNSTAEHLIMADVRKPREIDLIEANGGVIIELRRNFVFLVTTKEANKFYEEKGYLYDLSDGNNPVKLTHVTDIVQLFDSGAPIGIDNKPLPNLADSWLDGDDRKDFVFYNPAGNPKHMDTFGQLFREVLDVYPVILNKLLTNEAEENN